MLSIIQIILKVFCISHGWILNVGVLLHPIHRLLRVNHTPEKGGGDFIDKIKKIIYREGVDINTSKKVCIDVIQNHI